MTWGEAHALFDMTCGEAHALFDAMLDEVYDACRIGPLEFAPSRVLRELDPVAYRTCFNDYADSEGIDVDALIGPSDR